MNSRMRAIQAQTIRGIGEMIPHEVEGAQKLLVIIDQGHFAVTHLPWMHRSTEQCQKEILSAVEDLTKNDHTKLQELFEEGVPAGGERRYLQKIERQLKEYMAVVPDSRIDGEFLQIPSQPKSFEQRIRSSYFLNAKIPLEFNVVVGGMQTTKTVTTTTLAHIGAGPVLAYRGDVTLKGAEDQEIYSTALAINAEEEPERYVEWANVKREEHVLKLASANNDSITYVIFGARHQWQERVDEWNKNHASDFSLLRLRPREMVKVLKMLDE